LGGKKMGDAVCRIIFRMGNALEGQVTGGKLRFLVTHGNDIELKQLLMDPANVALINEQGTVRNQMINSI
jgi:hypothetical protein